MARVLGIFTVPNQTTAQKCSLLTAGPYHRIFFAIFLAKHAKLGTVTPYIQYSEVLLLPLI